MVRTTRPTPPPDAARRQYALSALLAQRAVSEAQKARSKGLVAVARALVTHQAVAAQLAERAVIQILLEQEIQVRADAILNSFAFTTDAGTFAAMADATDDRADFDRLVASLVQDAARAAESVATTVRPDIAHVRFEAPPSCARCAVLDGRVYRWSDGFLRHPGCDGVMVPTTVANGNRMLRDPVDMLDNGELVGLSKADAQAVRDGADLGQVVNVRRKAAGLQEAGRVLARAGRPTPEGIYRMASDRDEAVSLLTRFDYLRN